MDDIEDTNYRFYSQDIENMTYIRQQTTGKNKSHRQKSCY